MRVAIVHYWLLKMRGGEKVVEALCRLYPQADIFTLFYDPEGVSPLIRSKNVTTSFLNPLRKHYRSLLPLTPFALEHLDLRGYDLVISSESGPAKGVITSAATRHVCYCHSPMRYLWDLYPDYLHEWTRSGWRRATIAAFATPLRVWDHSTAARVDDFIANSANVQRRIRKAYRRESEVVHPPVAVEEFYHGASHDYFLIVSELVPYKRIEDAVRAFARSGRPLKIVGEGPEYRRLKRMATGNIEFCGSVPFGDLQGLYARCRALLMPGEEDFGITAVEALASGKAVIGLGRGGLLEITPAREFLYAEPGQAGLEGALEVFEKAEQSVDPEALRAHAAHFSEANFAGRIRALIGG
jgi:glycosyltransferase involved in cell wall biosynthesis